MGTRRVLLIDDEDDIREVTRLSLELVAHWDVISAHSGAEGILRAVSDQPDAILLDVMMPDMDGPTTFKFLRADPATRHIPIILLTATIHGAGHETLDVAAIIPKPFDPMRLHGQIAAALGWAS
jgi:CheY-like chemotaxis protein